MAGPTDGPLLMPSAAQTVLTADPEYMSLLAAQSMWPGQYVFGVPQPAGLRQSTIRGQSRVHVAADNTAPEYNTMLPTHVRIQQRASQKRLETELYGTAPLMTRRGWVNQVDTHSQLRQHNLVFKDSVRRVMEQTMNRPDFVKMPHTMVNLPETRLGQQTRAAPAYAKPGF